MPAYTWTGSSWFPVKATDFPRSELHRKPPLVLRNMLSCPEAGRSGYHEGVWCMHQLFLGDREDMDAIVDTVDRVAHEGLRDLDHKAIRNLA